eukprot:CAMPEP_0172650520 /NCGR_PEP_ID=MMETSP1068-20121228/242336_1 /TAXON_ID=35684 /ORGANISM="Pseudopedinella elastica, Strain CCMP716" /LENGTH=87 /DNA_ID=CAMNT_0013464887 /DNA_START=711 /DNA_END=971 /DNA_ORIENTATION=+
MALWDDVLVPLEAREAPDLGLNDDQVALDGPHALAHRLGRVARAPGDDHVPALASEEPGRKTVHQDHVPDRLERRHHARPNACGHVD